jgi:hypothetical protein
MLINFTVPLAPSPKAFDRSTTGARVLRARVFEWRDCSLEMVDVVIDPRLHALTEPFPPEISSTINNEGEVP